MRCDEGAKGRTGKGWPVPFHVYSEQVKYTTSTDVVSGTPANQPETVQTNKTEPYCSVLVIAFPPFHLRLVVWSPTPNDPAPDHPHFQEGKTLSGYCSLQRPQWSAQTLHDLSMSSTIIAFGTRTSLPGSCISPAFSQIVKEKKLYGLVVRLSSQSTCIRYNLARDIFPPHGTANAT